MQSILYYPTIDIKDSLWLRSAALYWDRVCSIVPVKGDYPFSPEILYMMERRQYRPIYAEDVLDSAYADEFVRTFKKHIHFLIRRHGKRLFTEPARGRYAQHELIHRRKFPYELYSWLWERGYISSQERDEWCAVSPVFAEVYMQILSEHAARYDMDDIVVSTDKRSNMDQFYRRAAPTEKNRLFTVNLMKCLPVPSMDVSFEEILDFKERRQEDLQLLQFKIHQLEYNIARSESEKEIKAVIEDFKQSWNRELHQAEKLFRGDGIGFFLSNLLTFIGAAGGTAGLAQWLETTSGRSMRHPLTEAAVGLSGAIAVALQYRGYRNKIKEEQQQQGFAYVIGAAKEGFVRGNYTF